MAIQFRNTEFVGVAVSEEQCPKDRLPEIVMSGRSNVGKSSLINSLADQRKIARISNTPGKTRQIIFFRIDQALYLVDLPGYGHAAVSKQAKLILSQLADTYLNSDRPIALVLLLLDIRISPTKQDRQMLEWLEQSGKPWRIILTKADKLSRSAGLMRRQAIARELDLADAAELV
ncbi:MAG: ribosome biogenesis GTP-binding protein YihA/YsxC, partial [Bacillota bacterium]|nr:ribosome biogenesis GTP-binding protein YihA/YsxC [Bacillota bacterium]